MITDRFDAPKLQYAEGGEATPCNVTQLSYCGGTFATVEGHLDYIMGMNFGAVWISPTVVNAPGGYHGYWCAPESGSSFLCSCSCMGHERMQAQFLEYAMEVPCMHYEPSF